MLYKAWIPNVSGNLSFSNIKGSKIPNRAKAPHTFNQIGNEKAGWIYSLQERDLSDAPFPNKEGKFYYLLKGEIQNRWEKDEALIGCVITYPKTQLKSSDKTLLNVFKSKEFSVETVEELINSWSIDPVFIKVNFTLYRDGFIELDFGDAYPTLDNDVSYSIVFESYSFLKDLIHAHKFHRYDDDSIVVPYPDETNTIVWVVKTLRNLHKSVVFSYRNATHQQDILNALGKLSYLDGFQMVAKKKYEGLIREDFWINTDNLRVSLDLKLKDQETIESNKSNLLQTVLNITLSIFALIIAMTQLLQVPCIDGLTYNASTCHSLSGQQFIFSLDNNSLNYVQMILKYWSSITTGMPIVIIFLIALLNFWRIDRWINNNIGHGWWGGYIRSILAFAVSEGAGRMMAFIWVGIFIVTMITLLCAALGLLHLSIA